MDTQSVETVLLNHQEEVIPSKWEIAKAKGTEAANQDDRFERINE